MIKFQDDNFKLACLDALFLNGLFKEELQELLSINPLFDEYGINELRMNYLLSIDISQEDLNTIKSFAPDGGDDIYTYVFPWWSGEEDELYLRDFRDIALLQNLEFLSINAITIEHSFNLMDIVSLPNLKKIDTNKFYVNNSIQKEAIAILDSKINIIIR